MKYLLRTDGLPSPGDPLGSSPDAPTISVLVDAEVLEELVGGKFRVRVADPGGGTFELEDVVEGDGPRELQTRSGVSLAQARAVRNVYATLGSDSSPAVRLAASAIRAAITGNSVSQVAADLVAVATGGAAGELRALAVLALGILLIEDRDR